MVRRLGFFILFLAVLGLLSAASGCRQEEKAENTAGTEPSKGAAGLAGQYVAGIKRDDGTPELYKLELNQQGNEINGTLYFLSGMTDSLEEYNDNPQKVDAEAFESFYKRPVRLTGKANGNSISFNTPEPLVIGNYIFQWDFNGQLQADNLTGKLSEVMKNDEGGDQQRESPQQVDITFRRLPGK